MENHIEKTFEEAHAELQKHLKVKPNMPNFLKTISKPKKVYNRKHEISIQIHDASDYNLLELLEMLKDKLIKEGFEKELYHFDMSNVTMDASDAGDWRWSLYLIYSFIKEEVNENYEEELKEYEEKMSKREEERKQFKKDVDEYHEKYKKWKKKFRELAELDKLKHGN